MTITDLDALHEAIGRPVFVADEPELIEALDGTPLGVGAPVPRESGSLAGYLLTHAELDRHHLTIPQARERWPHFHIQGDELR